MSTIPELLGTTWDYRLSKWEDTNLPTLKVRGVETARSLTKEEILASLIALSEELENDFKTFELLNRSSGGQGLAMNKAANTSLKLKNLINEINTGVNAR